MRLRTLAGVRFYARWQAASERRGQRCHHWSYAKLDSHHSQAVVLRPCWFVCGSHRTWRRAFSRPRHQIGVIFTSAQYHKFLWYSCVLI